MKKFISTILFVVFFLFNVNGLDKDIEAFKNYLSNEYVLYPELVERGFDISKLDNMEVNEELFEYVEYFFRPNDEKGWLPLDNHHKFTVKYCNAASRDTASLSTTYKKSVKFSNKFGTKDELLNEGYVENETMFYYPSNGEKDWRVGEWRWTTATKAQYDKGTNFDINFSGEKTIGEKKLDNDIWCDVFESEKSFVISLSKIRKDILDIELPKKDNIIIDMTHSYGGTISIGEEFVSKVLNINYKRIIVLMNDADSASEDVIYNLSKDKRTILIGLNTNGTALTFGKEKIFNQGKITFKSMSLKDDNPSIKEGLGINPNIWCKNAFDIFINLWNITEDYELEFGYQYPGYKTITHNLLISDIPASQAAVRGLKRVFK